MPELKYNTILNYFFRFFRRSKFKFLEEHLIEFNQLAMTHAQGSDVMLNRVMTKDNIALAVMLETRDDVWTTLPPKQVPYILE